MSDIGKIYLRGPLVGSRSGVTFVSITINGLDISDHPGSRAEAGEPTDPSSLRTVEVSPRIIRHYPCTDSPGPLGGEADEDALMRRYGPGKTMAEIVVDLRDCTDVIEPVNEESILGAAFRPNK